MGYSMADYLKTRGGHAVCVHNHTGRKAHQWVELFGGTMAPMPWRQIETIGSSFAVFDPDDAI